MRRLLATGLLLVVPLTGPAEEAPRTMRLDYYHTGNTRQELHALDRVVLEPLPWPGNPEWPIDRLGRGNERFEVIDQASGKVLYSRGFGSIYGEWVTTAEARQRSRTFHESLRFPAPDKPIRVVVQRRQKNHTFTPVWETSIDPEDISIDRSIPAPPGDLIALVKHGPPARKVDLLLLGDGYTADEREKFIADAKRLSAALFATAPFKDRQKDFNVWGLCPPAAVSGVSRPSSRIYRASPLGSTYDVFGSERYLMTYDNRAFRTVASFAPYDVVEILVNSPTYGGGGIYNLYGTVAAASSQAAYVFVHEFGHHFAALADEYYASPVAYLAAKQRQEPWEPNVTALLAPDKLKWKDLVAEATPLPTPWPKQEYDRFQRDYQSLRVAIRKANQPEAAIDELFRREKVFTQRLLGQAAYAGKVGAFEGAGYQSTGYYRPEINCIMFSRTQTFCAVCRRAIEQVMDQYTAPGPKEARAK